MFVLQAGNKNRTHSALCFPAGIIQRLGARLYARWRLAAGEYYLDRGRADAKITKTESLRNIAPQSVA